MGSLAGVVINSQTGETVPNATISLGDGRSATTNEAGMYMFDDVKPEQYVLGGVYVPMRATLSDDDRVRNNSLGFVAVGEEYPPVLLWEVLANPDPSTSLSTEWVELFNRSALPIDLDGYGLGDQGSVRAIVDSSYILLSGEYLVLCEDSLAFRVHYLSYDGLLHQPTSWPGFRNSNDTVRLIDFVGFESDRFVYVSSFADNYTWQRDVVTGDNQWGRSEQTGGTPGGPNVTVFEPNAPRTRINITPEYLSPDGDGFQDEVAITIEAVDASGYTMKLFDRQGRLVHTFFEDASHIGREYLFDGKINSGQRLPIGIYILYFEAIGVEQFKKTLVVAR